MKCQTVEVFAFLILSITAVGCSSQQTATMQNFGKKTCEIQGRFGPAYYGGTDAAVPLSARECGQKQSKAARQQKVLAAQQVAQPFNLSASNGLHPVISGNTTLPEGTRVTVFLKKPWLPDGQARMARGLAACGDDCLPATAPDGLRGADVIVAAHQITAGPFSFQTDDPFPPGRYLLEIAQGADLTTSTPDEIQAIGTVLFRQMVDIPGPK